MPENSYLVEGGLGTRHINGFIDNVHLDAAGPTALTGSPIENEPGVDLGRPLKKQQRQRDEGIARLAQGLICVVATVNAFQRDGHYIIDSEADAWI